MKNLLLLPGNPSRVCAWFVIWPALLAGTASGQTITQADGAATAKAAEVQSTNAGPRIQFAATLWDFGRVESGKVLTNLFWFTNTGDQNLVIKDVWSSCGCTTTEKYDRNVAPGKSGLIPVLLDTSGASGELVKFLRVMSNDPTNSNVPLYLGGIVWQPIDAIPKVAGFLFGPDAYTNQTRVVRLVSNLEESVEISAPVWNDASIQAELKTLREGKEFELIVTRLVPTEGEGSHTIPITLKTSSPRMPVVTVSTYTTILPAVKLAPPRALLSQSPLTNAEQLTVTVRNQSTNAITLTEPSLNAEGASIELRETRKGREFELVMNFPAGFVLQSEARLEARVKSSSPRAPVIKVPISLAGADAEPGGLAAMLAAEAAAEAASKADGKPSGESGTGKAKKD